MSLHSSKLIRVQAICFSFFLLPSYFLILFCFHQVLHAPSNWWIIWNGINPSIFPLPTTLHQYTWSREAWNRSLLVDPHTNQETLLGLAIHTA